MEDLNSPNFVYHTQIKKPKSESDELQARISLL